MNDQSKKRALSDWDNRPPSLWGEDIFERINREITLLEMVQAGGCDKTRDGLSVKMHLDERREKLREIIWTQRGD